MYRLLFRVVLSKFDAERAHDAAFFMIRMLSYGPLAALVRRATRPRAELTVRTLGLAFPTPFGLAAGFDKDARGIRGLGNLGFGHVEVGTITALPQPGNERPRLARLVRDRALINRMGFNNHGAGAASDRLRRLTGRHRPVVGVNIGKSRVVDVADATSDYLASAAALAPVADYLVVNVSSPNTPGLRGLQELDMLEPLLRTVKEAAGRTPLLVKIAPDLGDDELRKIAELVLRIGLDGIIATNTTTSRKGLVAEPSEVERAGTGGLSGAPLAARSLEVLRVLRSVVPAELCIISVGGVETASDVDERLAAGATLVQGYTAFIYHGPFWARDVTRGLESLREVGTDHR